MDQDKMLILNVESWIRKQIVIDLMITTKNKYTNNEVLDFINRNETYITKTSVNFIKYCKENNKLNDFDCDNNEDFIKEFMVNEHFYLYSN